MQGDSLQVAETVRDVLGPALNDVVGLIEEDGECARCAGVLGSTGVSISVWTVRPLHLTAVVPTHTRCRTSGCVTVEELPPPTHNSVVFRGLHAPPPPAARRRWWRPTVATPSTTMTPLTVLINPSRDIQIGEVLDGRWVSDLDRNHVTYGLDPMVQGQPQNESWGAFAGVDDPTVHLEGPGQSYTVNVTGIPDPAADQDRIVVLVSDRVKAGTIVAERSPAAVAEAPAGTVYGALAVVGSAPADLPLPLSGQAWAPEAPGREWVRTTSAVRSQEADTSCNLRATFANDPSVALLPTPAPVLLVEPLRAVVAAHTQGGAELRVTNARGRGLAALPPRVTAQPPSSPLSVRTRGMDTELLTKQGDVLGAGPLADVPAGWHAAVAAAGGQLIVVYGCAIGVRPAAPGKPFPAAARRRELAHSQTGNLAAWGLARWR